MIKLYSDEISLEYLAGIVDGEGSIGIYRSKSESRYNPSYSVRLSVTNCNIELLEDIRAQFGGSVSLTAEKSTRRSCGKWYIDGKKAAPLLRELFPLLRIKGLHAVVALRMIEEMDGHSNVRLSAEEVAIRDEMYFECKALNHSG